MTLKGVILAGGTATRLRPVTPVVSKHLLPLHDRPMVYYPLSILILAGVTEIVVVVTPEHRPLYEALLKDGRQWNIRIRYQTQERAGGLAEGLVLSREYIGNDRCALILGDNVIYGRGLRAKLRSAAAREAGATVFTYRVPDGRQYAVVEIDEAGRPVSLEEKPVCPKSDYAVIGLYFL